MAATASSIATTPLDRRAAPAPRPSIAAVAAALILLAAGILYLDIAYGWRQATLYALGGLAGLALYHASFGFTAAWRAFLIDARGAGLRAQMAMLALTTIVFVPLIVAGSMFGTPVVGAIAPAGLSVALGAFLFGIGMQLGGGCASGTLFAIGSGSTRLCVTFAFFVIGSIAATLHLPWWLALPSLGEIGLAEALGLWPALILQLALFAAIWWASRAWEMRRHGAILADPRGAASADHGRSFIARLAAGPWPIVAGAGALALVNIATLAVTGHPWSVTFAFALWGAKLFAALGIDVASWEFWTWPVPARSLTASVLADETTVMDIGIVLGALLAAGAAGRFRPERTIPLRPLLAAIIGGLMLGYGARLAFGCNIGALFSGVASGSLHGWLWLLTGLAGNYVGVKLRPGFALAVERSVAQRS